MRFDGQRRGAWLQAYGGRVVGLGPGLDIEAGLATHTFENVSRYDYQEAYASLLGEGWQLRIHGSPDYYGVGQRSLYVELNGRQALSPGWAATGHVGLLRVFGTSPYAAQSGSMRLDLRLGLSGQLGSSSEVQLAWVGTGRGGPYTWAYQARRRSVVLSVTTAF
ncbi:hypothetical protein DBR42_03030 [Pelomonas sp. HMWF004]|nr:hypothetical protein DBR42_03030 [Pelomonas sp. HMWF004]